jgi:hypothetical protein
MLMSSLLSDLADLQAVRRRNRLPEPAKPEPVTRPRRRRARRAALDAALARREAERVRRPAERSSVRPVEPASHAVASRLGSWLDSARSLAGPAAEEIAAHKRDRLHRRPAPVTVTTAEGGRHVRHPAPRQQQGT